MKKFNKPTIDIIEVVDDEIITTSSRPDDPADFGPSDVPTNPWPFGSL